MFKIYLILITTVLLLSCTAGRKFDYKSAYRFKYLKYTKLSGNDSLPLFLVSSDRGNILQGKLNLNHFKFHENTVLVKKNTRPKTSRITRSEIKYSKSKINFGKNLPVLSMENTLKGIKRNTNNNASKHTSGFRDLHPALQGFLFIVIGFGTVLAGALVGSIPVLPTILIIAGFLVAAFGFYLIATQI